MATANIRAEITAQDRASAVVQNFGKNVEKANGKISKSSATATDRLLALGAVTLGARRAFSSLAGVITDTVQEANKAQAAIVGLSSVAKAFNVNVDDATEAAEKLAEDGLMTVTDAATGLKNLLASRFNLDQAVTLMERFKDSAAFGRQSALSFGQAVTSATEGIKNGNSILVDNAGVTKNLSMILTEAGFSAQDLMRATTDASVRQALFNGIIKETNPQLGDANRLTELYAGKQAVLQAETVKLKQQVGEALQPALLKLLETITPMIEKMAAFISQHPELSANIILVTAGLVGLTAALGTLGLAIVATKTAMAGLGVQALLTSGAFAKLAAFVKSPAMLGPWGVLGAVGVGAFIKIQNAAKETKRVLDNTVRAVEKAYESDTAAIGRANDAIRKGDYRAADNILNSISPGRQTFKERGFYALGGDVPAGRPIRMNEETGRGETFIPKTPGKIVPNNQMRGDTIHLNVNLGVFTGTAIERRKLAETIWNDLKDIASARGKTPMEMMA